VSHEIEDLALQSEEDRQAAEDRILAVEAEFDNTLAAIEAARHQLHDLLPCTCTATGAHADDSADQKTARSLDQAMRQDLATITQLKVSSWV
jgi:uncharacterized protein YhaN